LWGRPSILQKDFESTKELNIAIGERNFKKVAGVEYRVALCLPDNSECSGSYIHGHVGEGRGVDFCGITAKEYNNLESNVGKYSDEDKGYFRIYYCGTHQPALNLFATDSPELRPKKVAPTLHPPVLTLPPAMSVQRDVDTPTGGCPSLFFMAKRKPIQLLPDKPPERKQSFCGI